MAIKPGSVPRQQFLTESAAVYRTVLTCMSSRDRDKDGLSLDGCSGMRVAARNSGIHWEAPWPWLLQALTSGRHMLGLGLHRALRHRIIHVLQ